MRRPAGGPSSTGERSETPQAVWDCRTPLTLTVKYRSGPEAWWEVKARGRVFRFPGHVAIHDVMREVTGVDQPR